MKHSKHDRLLRDALADESVERLRAQTLADMLLVARRRRRQRTLLPIATACVVLASMALIVTRPSPHDVDVSLAVSPPSTAKSDGIRILTDEQLLELFSDRSVALIDKSGEKQLVFLDAPARSRAVAEKP